MAHIRKKPEYDMKVLGRNLKKCRESLGYSVEQVRQYLNLGSAQSVYQYETGKALPRGDSMLALLELYGVRPEELREEDFTPSADRF